MGKQMFEEMLAMLNYWFNHCQRNNGKGEEENIENEEEDLDREE